MHRSNADLTDAMYIQPLIDNRMSQRRQIFLKLTNTHWVFSTRMDTSYNVRSLGDIQLPK